MVGTVEIITGIKIPAGESLSNGVDCSAGRVIRITTPAEWDHAEISFQVSSDGNGYSDLYRQDGTEVEIPCGKNRGIIVHQDEWLPGLFVKIRSGTSVQPYPQSEEREFAIALLVEGGVT